MELLDGQLPDLEGFDEPFLQAAGLQRTGRERQRLIRQDALQHVAGNRAMPQQRLHRGIRRICGCRQRD